MWRSASSRRVVPVLVAVALVWTAAVVVVLVAHARADERSARERVTTQRVLIGVLDQESAVRGYGLSGAPGYLDAYRAGGQTTDTGLRSLHAMLGDDAAAHRELETHRRLVREWRRQARPALSRPAAAGGPSRSAAANAPRRLRTMSRLRETNRSLAALVQQRARARVRTATLSTWLLVVLGGFAVAAVAGLAVRRITRRETRRQKRRAEYGRALSSAEDEAEVHDVLRAYASGAVPAARVHVLAREAGSAGPLRAATSLGEAPGLARALEQAGARSCLAVRHGRTHTEAGDADALQRCAICGRGGAPTTCVPIQVGGQVIGTALAEHERSLDADESRALEDAVAQAAPVLGRLQALVEAEQRASTDALTELPNRRTIQESFTRQLAHATRTITPLSVLLLDLDHFKAINDTYGHACGDAALAAVGRTLRASLRTADEAGRYGGEEFVVLLPDTDSSGAHTVAEKLRKEIADLVVPGLGDRLSASLGIATYPEHGDGTEDLLRLADRALYAAKDAGRDRVCVAPALEP